MAAGLGPVKEGRALLPGDDRRPAMDVTVVTPLQAATVAEAAITPDLVLHSPLPTRGRCGELQRTAAGRALLFCLWWWSPWEAGTQPLRPK